MLPLVSVIIPCFNYGHLLDQTLSSLQNQSLKSWECIIVNDGSTDNTAEIAIKYCSSDERFFYIYQSNKGLSAARNTGISAAKSEFIQFLDADDFLSEQKIELQYNFMLDHPEADICYTNAVYFAEQEPNKYYKGFRVSPKKPIQFINESWIPEFNDKGIKIIEYLLSRNIAPVNSMLIRKNVINRAGYFDESYFSLEDWEYWIRCAFSDLRFTYFKHQDAYAIIRIHTSSMTFNSSAINHFQLKLQGEMIKKLQESQSEEIQRILKGNMRTVESHYRQIMEKLGLSNFKEMKLLATKIGWSKFLKLYIKELNALRRKG